MVADSFRLLAIITAAPMKGVHDVKATEHVSPEMLEKLAMV